jgi:hypothetical protein
MTSSAKTFRCDFAGCDRSFTSSRGLATHRRVHAADIPPPPVAVEPPRPLRLAGLDLWNEVHTSGKPTGSIEALLILCEQLDERSALRVRVIQHNDAKDRAGLRSIEEQILKGLRDIGLVSSLPLAHGDASDWTQEDG